MAGRGQWCESASSASARRAPCSSPAPEVWPIAASAAARAGSSGVPSAARYAANSGSTSPCSAQSSRVADSRVVRRERGADGGVDGRAWRTPAARCTASQPQSTSSPCGVSPSPRPTSRATASGPSGPGPRRRRRSRPPVPAGRAAEPVPEDGRAVEPRRAASTIRPTRSGVLVEVEDPAADVRGPGGQAAQVGGGRSAARTAPRRPAADARRGTSRRGRGRPRAARGARTGSGPSGAAREPVPDRGPGR